jgi:hypothetical protein
MIDSGPTTHACATLNRCARDAVDGEPRAIVARAQ